MRVSTFCSYTCMDVELGTVSRCTATHISFEALGNGDHRAYDVFCGISNKGHIWYCSERCRDDTPKLRYKDSSEDISDD